MLDRLFQPLTLQFEASSCKALRVENRDPNGASNVEKDLSIFNHASNPDESSSILHDSPLDFSLRNRDPGAAPQASPASTCSSAHGSSRAERPDRNRQAIPSA